VKRIGIIFNPRRQEAIDVSRKFQQLLSGKGITSWLCSAWEPEHAKGQLAGTDLLLSVGGDGTILRTARLCSQNAIPILGINQGRLGFMTELTEAEAIAKLPSLLNGDGWIEERSMLEINLPSHNKTIHALNDVFIGRRSSARLVTIDCTVNSSTMAVYRADGVIVATASGSTGYSLAAGGPILHPETREIVITPVCPHFSFNKPAVVPADAIIELKVTTNHEAMTSIDSQIELQLNSGDQAIVKLSSCITRFLRFQPRNYFFASLESRLKRNI
jgi:NAD+ kinase